MNVHSSILDEYAKLPEHTKALLAEAFSKPNPKPSQAPAGPGSSHRARVALVFPEHGPIAGNRPTPDEDWAYFEAAYAEGWKLAEEHRACGCDPLELMWRAVYGVAAAMVAAMRKEIAITESAARVLGDEQQRAMARVRQLEGELSRLRALPEVGGRKLNQTEASR